MNEALTKFYLIYPFGLSHLGFIELKEKWELYYPEVNLSILEKDEAGLLIEVPKLLGFSLNLILKTPTRILERIETFKAKDFPKLYQKVSQIKWNQYLIGQIPEISATASESRLFDSRKIEKAIKDGIEDSYKAQEVKKKFLNHLEKMNSELLPKVYCRIVNDEVTLSLDTTGELAHKRGEKTLSAMAPIRETLASLLLVALKNVTTFENLIDPMCGSGTFLLEAAHFYQLNNSRDFAFFHTPHFITLKDNGPLYKTFQESLKPQDKKLFTHLFGFDSSQEVLKQTRENLKLANVTLETHNVFEKKEFNIERAVAIVNPPYGIRVGQKSQIKALYYHDIIESLFAHFKVATIGIIIPDEHQFNPDRWNLKERIPFKNGGIPVSFYLFTSPS